MPRRELLRSNAELEQFAYVASHDLQEPLRKVASFCQLLEKRYGDQLDERGRQYIDFAVDGAKRLQILINDLLTFSRVGRADQTSASGCRSTRRWTPRSRRCRPPSRTPARSSSVPGRCPRCWATPTLLAMLWQNLSATGSSSARPDRTRRIRITVAAGRRTDMWQFCVEDNGIGIAPEFAEKVFVIFQRLHGRDAYAGHRDRPGALQADRRASRRRDQPRHRLRWRHPDLLHPAPGSSPAETGMSAEPGRGSTPWHSSRAAPPVTEGIPA